MPASSPKNTPLSRTIVLKLSSTLLSRFPSDSPSVEEKDTKIKDASSPPSSTSGEAGLQASSFDNASDAASTPAGADGSKAKKASANGSRGTKRPLNQNGESNGAAAAAASKPPRSRPSAAKKRLKLDDKALDTTKLMPPGHKLGPKANQGAINAGLRALDRTGAPCRKWERKPLQLKSFTGIVWGLSSWRTPKPLQQQSTESSGAEDANGITVVVNGDSDSKANLMSSAVPSEKSNAGEGDVTSLPPSTAQSPTPAIAMTA